MNSLKDVTSIAAFHKHNSVVAESEVLTDIIVAPVSTQNKNPRHRRLEFRFRSKHSCRTNNYFIKWDNSRYSTD